MNVPDRHSLPSLSSLRAFEATARLGSFAAAARALNVTPAAVAQQVRALEAELGVALTARAGRGIALTAAGERLAAALSAGFGAIADGVTGLRAADRGRGLRLTCGAGIAESVLMPRLGEFWERHPDIPVSLVPSSQVMDLRRDGFDLAIRTGPENADWPGLVTEPLGRNRFLVVAAPSLLGDDPPDLAALPWLLDTGSTVEDDWLRDAGLDPDKLRILRIENGALGISAARNGLGLLFATDAVVRADLGSGALCEVPFPNLPWIRYYTVTLPGPRRAALDAFLAWLKTLIRV